MIFKHGLRASLTPIVTMFGLDIALLVGGAVITESVFNLQGLGYLAINSALQQDLPIVLGVVLHRRRSRSRSRTSSSTSSTRSSTRECATRERGRPAPPRGHAT